MTHWRIEGLHFEYGEGHAERFGAGVAKGLILLATYTYPQLTRHAYPGQPSTRTRPPVKPCTCYYHPYSWWADWQLGSHFIVDPACPHHGDTHD